MFPTLQNSLGCSQTSPRFAFLINLWQKWVLDDQYKLMILSFVFWEYGCGLLSMGKQSTGKLWRTSGHPPLQKARTFGLGPPPAPISIHGAISHQSCMAHSGARWVLCGARFATKTIFQGAPLPTEHSKITIVHGIGCSLDLSISYHCFFVFGEYGCGLSSVGKQSIDKLCRMSGHLLLQKARTFGLGSPPARPE